MSAAEFAHGASRWRSLLDLDRTQAIAAACRGSGNPASLAWIAEALGLDESSAVVDIGAGLGGAAAWLSTHYGCQVVAADPVLDASRCADEVFGLPAVVALGTALPLRDHCADAAIALGVLSVVDDPLALLREARRVADRLAVLAYLSTSDSEVRCGGSTFRPRPVMLDLLRRSGWTVEAGPEPTTMDAPPTWVPDEPDADVDPDEAAVIEALEEGRIEPYVAVATGGPHREPEPR